ncbi:hypothetical protein A0H76_1203 [Hepatospora eriocheir]|uniref:Uncharacterized protein n=1 Tax=Hepatospora eriocheir TaxID=1081669 RepID=A0A1X0QHI9_9MICR|nr:hypothetical protein A0H76_1203 [Hepatospora eriocheir]
MKKVSWQQIKSESFNLVSVVEESIEINPKDIPSSFSNLTNIIVELRSLKEALLFKKAKQLKKVSITDSDKQIELFDKLNEKIRKVKIEPLGDAKNVLEKNKEILELKTIQKIFRYAIEIENDPEKVLSLLLESEMREDWEFLCNLIYVYLKFGKNDNKTIFLNYSKKVEDKLVNLFKESYENEKYSQCKSAFKALEVLEKEKVLFETFLYFYSPFNKPVNVIGYHTNKIYLDKTINPENNSFHSFFKEVSEVTNKIGSLGTFIFGTSGDFLNFAVGKMYNVYIARALELYLELKIQTYFLLHLKMLLQHFLLLMKK